MMDIQSTDYWVKILDNHQENWALLEPSGFTDGCTVFFLGSNSGVFDRLRFHKTSAALDELRLNGFHRLSENQRARELYEVPPQPPFFEWQHPNGPIYSSGRFWRNLGER